MKYEIIDTPIDTIPSYRPNIAGADRETYGSIDLARPVLVNDELEIQPVLFERDDHYLVVFYTNPFAYKNPKPFERCLRVKQRPARFSSEKTSIEMVDAVGIFSKGA